MQEIDTRQWLAHLPAALTAPTPPGYLVRSDLVGLGFMDADETRRALAEIGAAATVATVPAMMADQCAPIVQVYFQHKSARVMVSTPPALRLLLAACVLAPTVRAVFVLARVPGEPFGGNQIAAWYRLDPAARWLRY